MDLKIGLDIAWIASQRLDDKLIIITADSDFVPALLNLLDVRECK